MQYEDPFIDEEKYGNANVSKESPLKTLAKFSIALLTLLIAGYIALSILVHQVVHLIPFETEKRWFEPLTMAFLSDLNDESTDFDDLKKLELQRIADKLVNAAITKNPNHPLSRINIVIHYSNDPTINAFALPGGNIVVMKGLIDAIPNENALAMVIAHEMAHVIHRDSLRGIGRGVLTNLIVLSMFGADGNLLMNESVELLSTKYSRSAETSADETGLELLYNAYGNAYGASQLFSVFSKVTPEQNRWITISSTHPSPDESEANMRDKIKKRQYHLDNKNTTPLPNQLTSD